MHVFMVYPHQRRVNRFESVPSAMFGANVRDASYKTARTLLQHISRGLGAESSAHMCSRSQILVQDLSSLCASGTFRRMAPCPQAVSTGCRSFASEAAQGKVAEGQATGPVEEPPAREGEEEGPRLDAIFLRTVLIASVIGAGFNAWSSGPGMYGSPSTHILLLKGTPHMRSTGLQRLKKAVEAGQYQLEIQEHRIPERLVALLLTEPDLDVWRELCSTLAAMLTGPGSSQDFAVLSLCATLSQRLCKEDATFRAAAEPLLQKLAQSSDSEG